MDPRDALLYPHRVIQPGLYMWNSLPYSVVDTCTVNAFKARYDNFWQHQLVKFDLQPI